MTFTEVDERPQQLIDQLVCVWKRSVRASHVFLSSADVERIKGYVPQAILAVEHLVVAFENNTPIAFLGVNESMLEMLFVDADVRRRGIGSALLEYGVSELGIRELTVNEQNPAAMAFYEAHGFRTVDRLETDEQGERWNKVQANEHRYGTEARERYGNEAVDASREKLLSMSDAEWESKKSSRPPSSTNSNVRWRKATPQARRQRCSRRCMPVGSRCTGAKAPTPLKRITVSQIVIWQINASSIITTRAPARAPQTFWSPPSTRISCRCARTPEVSSPRVFGKITPEGPRRHDVRLQQLAVALDVDLLDFRGMPHFQRRTVRVLRRATW